MRNLLEKRLIFVTGKGGVGKSTVSAALGMVAARQGKRTIICEVSQQEKMSRYFDREGVGFEEAELAENLFAISIDPEKSIEQYLRIQIKIKPVADLLFSNRIFHYFAAATPGLKELVTVGKAWEIAQFDRWVKGSPKYDLVIVDAPATGHGIGLLKTPKMFADIARVGPVKRQGEKVHNFITDRKLTGVVAVAWPEEMPVAETVELEDRLARELGVELSHIFMNGLYPERFSKTDAALMQAQSGPDVSDGPEDTLVRAALKASLSEQSRAKSQRGFLQKLKRAADGTVVPLPYLFQTEFDANHFGLLADKIEAAVRGPK